MTRHSRSRRLVFAALAAVHSLALAACSSDAPNTTLTPHTDLGRSVDALWHELLILGTIVFVLVEAALIVTIWRWRHREGVQPRDVHGNTALEITWTLIPAVVLAFIAVPTVRTIFKTQAQPIAGALQVDVIGHQWWWEFRYPQYGITTANELYLAAGRTASFNLKTQDVLHSFWIPQLGGKRDLITNHVNHLWFTPEVASAYNGACAEYCGASHANMRFRVFTVSTADFDAWVANQKAGPALVAPMPGAPPPASPTPTAAPSVTTVAKATNRTTPAADSAKVVAPSVMSQAGFVAWPTDKLPGYVVPHTPVPAGLTFSNVTGDAMRGAGKFRVSACIACHTVQSVSAGMIGPNLTHVGSRTTIAAGLFPNTEQYMRLWIKNARLMKPGVLMNTFGAGQYDPQTRAVVPGGLSDQDIADLAAYLLSLK